MKNELIEVRKRLNKFNDWEIKYSKNLSVENRLDQFEELFNLIYELPNDIKEKGHKDHLDNLISVQKKLQIKGNK